jgi:hypothetical protein
MKPFEIEMSPRGADTWAIPQSDAIYVKELTAAATASQAVPDGAFSVLFQAVDASGNQAPFWAKFDAEAAIAAADVADGSASEPNPVHRSLYGVETIGLISPVDCFVYMMFYGAPA